MTVRQRLSLAGKIAVSHVLHWSGALRLWQTIVLRRKAVVLMYHRVLSRDEIAGTASHPALVVDVESFARQMAVLRRRFRVLSVEEFAQCIEQKRAFPDSSCLITFDDGWKDNFTNALPILRRHQLPALIFLPSNYIGQKRLFWQESLTHLLVRALEAVAERPGRREAFEALLSPFGLAGVLDLRGVNPRAQIIAMIGGQKRASRCDVERLLAELAQALDVSLEDLDGIDGFMTWQQVDAMKRQGIAFGGHGMDHLLLSYVSAEEADREFAGSKALVSGALKEPVATFSYPNGYKTADIIGRVRAAGYQLAFITGRGHVTCHDDPFTIRRVNIHDSATASVPMFLARLVGLW